MRPRNTLAENTSFQDAGPFLPQLDIKTDVAMVYGLTESFEERLAAWTNAGYRPHVMTGVAWGEYQDYVRGEWDDMPHYDDAQMTEGQFPLEHGVKQGHDVYYMVPTRPYTNYLAAQLRRVVDAGAIAIHLEEPEFWVRAGYSPSFQAEWAEFYGEPWQDPASSPDARYRCARLKQYLYTRSLDTLMRDLKAYAVEKGNPDFKCYVPTHSLLNYAHWRIVSPESALLGIEDCDGIIAQVWTGTARTPNVYQGVRKERTFETAFCEYASAAALARHTDFRVWLLSDPIEDNPNFAWPDYRVNWECTVTASLFFPETARFEVTPWPSRVFLRTYPKENLRDKPLRPLLDAHLARLESEGKTDLLAAMQDAFAAFQDFVQTLDDGPMETLGFAALPDDDSDQQRFGDVLGFAFAFYKYLSATRSPEDDQRLRDALAAFYFDPPIEREYIPAEYATELQVVFNALADMDWPEDEVEWVNAPDAKIALAISDTMMFQRGEPAASDPDLSFIYGLALPLLKRGVPLDMIQMERMGELAQLGSDLDVLMLTYEGLKPPSAKCHAIIAQWVRESSGKLVLFGAGDDYDSARAWWNEGEYTYQRAQDHLTDLLGLGCEPQLGVHEVGTGQVLIVPDSPTQLAHDPDGSARVWGHLTGLVSMQPRNTLILRRGPYVIAARLDESVNNVPVTLPGKYVNLYDAALPVVIDPAIQPDTRYLLVDIDRADPDHAWILAASGRVDQETITENSLSCVLSGAAGTVMVLRALLPSEPRSVEAGSQSITYAWDAKSRTVFVTGEADPGGVSITVRF